MTLFDTINMFFNNIGMTFPDAMLLVVVCLSLIFSIQDHKIGLISMFLMSVTSFIYFALTGFDVTKALILVFVSIILMAFTIFTSRQERGLF